MGDKTLQSVAHCLRTSLPKHDLIARFGGDEFVILLKGSISHTQRLMEKLLDNINAIEIGDEHNKFYLSACIGMTPLYINDTEADALNRADIACYEVKHNGGSGISVNYRNTAEEDRNVTSFKHYALIQSIKQALQENQLQLYAQDFLPLRDAQGREPPLPKRSEILVRFIDHSGIVPPNQILAVTDRYNITQKIDLWVIEQLTHLIMDGHIPPCHLNVNLSMQSFHSQAVYDAISNLLSTCKSSQHEICLELTESCLVKNLQVATQFIHRLRAQGASFALDDFGAGYASFGLLQQVPLDMLKLDGSLIEAIETSNDTKEIVRSVYQMATAMHLQTVAEHVASEKTLDWLKQLGIHYAQSYLHSIPYPIGPTPTVHTALDFDLRQSS